MTSGQTSNTQLTNGGPLEGSATMSSTNATSGRGSIGCHVTSARLMKPYSNPVKLIMSVPNAALSSSCGAVIDIIGKLITGRWWSRPLRSVIIDRL